MQPSTATHTVQSHVYRVRRALGEDAWRLETAPPGYRLKVSPEEFDADVFTRLAVDGREHLSAGRPGRAAEAFDEALGLWRGRVLNDMPDFAALEPERARLEGMRVTMLEDRAEAQLAQGRHTRIVDELEGLVAEHPFRERLWGQLMVALYRAGRQAEALTAFRRVSHVLAEELGLDPGPRLTRLHDQILIHHPSLVQDPAMELELEDGLPRPRTSFVGRGRELADLAGLLVTRRLVTVTGPPGSGKTRLALQAAGGARESFPHGLWYVSLAEIDEPDQVALAMAAVLGVSAPDGPIVEAVVDHVRGRRMLLVLDNFEHVLGAAPLVARLLDTAPGMQVLVTSRAPLRLSGEQEYPLAPLPIPRADDVAQLDGVGDIDAVRLFSDRARDVQPQFAVTVENAPAVAHLVGRVDGLPLAIELAAARLRALPLEELGRRLAQSLDALTESPVDLPQRQRTLRRAIAWSYELLDPELQSLFRRLSVFRGGFALDAAEAVAGAAAVSDVMPGVAALVEAGLLQRPPEAGPPRYTMLETIRMYAIECLRAVGEEQDVARRHADFFIGVVEQAEPELTRAAQAQWLAALETEHANLLAVLRWASHGGDTNAGLAMAGRMWRYWQLRGHLAEGRSWLETLLAQAGDEPTAPRVKALIGLAGIHYYQGDWYGAEVCYRRALDVLEHLDEWWLHVEALAGLAIAIACHRGAPELAAPVEQQLRALVEGTQDPLAIGLTMATSATVRLFARDLDGSRQYNEQVLAACRALGERWYEGETLRMLALTSLLQGRYEQAEDELLAALAIAWETGALVAVAIDLDRLSWAATSLGEAERAIVLGGAASRLREEVGSTLVAAAGDFTLEGFRWGREDPREAARKVLTPSRIDVAWARGRSLSTEEAVGYARKRAATTAS